ncbi:diguanylate cyclase [Vibrio sp. JC009]|uniref:diguanylate cyclase domain-containing protein n=1 Tax=Vibrio sp. JC009 TaxID=2912314 RepID=UPI0023B19422|nr:diguanylate cyclase [Vibrio sp. JC009]WED24859.1 diguanylate cyclase [Vibrio sp. JC009]
MNILLARKQKHLRNVTLLVFACWTLSLVGLLSWTIWKEEKHAEDYARLEAKASFNKDVALRQWSAKHGGVYVPVSEDTPPNPYLSNIPDRDIVAPEGKQLTLMNPAYMIRQTMHDYSQLYGIKGRITSLNPLNPINVADEWEKKVLTMFERGVEEYSEITQIDGEPYLRYMQAFMTEESCLKCHENQGYKVGDVRGGVGVSVPVEPYMKLRNETIETAVWSYGLIWLLGILGMVVANRSAREHIMTHHSVELALTLEKEKAEQLSQLDPLTNLYNRRYLDLFLDDEIKRAAREQQPLGLLMVDIDWFKLYNNSLGQVVGDQVLQSIAHRVGKIINRPADCVARYDGDKFCVVLANIDIEEVRKTGERLRVAIESLKIPTGNETIGPYMYITISIGGITVTPGENTQAEHLLEAADKALYQAKLAGKNLAVIDELKAPLQE